MRVATVFSFYCICPIVIEALAESLDVPSLTTQVTVQLPALDEDQDTLQV